MRPTNRLQGRVAVVTGSTRGLGLFMAAALAQAGADIVISSRSMDAVEAAYGRFADIPGVEILGVECDVRDLKQVKTLAQRTLDRFGRLDVWVNNAGIVGPYGPTDVVPPERWRGVIETNLFGTYHGTIVALEHMQAQNRGKIINMLGAGSDDNRRSENEFLSAYTSSKAAVRRFTLVTAAEYKDAGISILGFNPGLVRTDMTVDPEPLTEEAAVRVQRLDWALDRFETPIEDVGEKIVELASDATDGVTGEIYSLRPGLLTIAKRWLNN